MEFLAGMILVWMFMRLRREAVIRKRLHDVTVLQELERAHHQNVVTAFQGALTCSAALIDKLKEALLQKNEGIDTSRDLERSMLNDALKRETRLCKVLLEHDIDPGELAEE